MVNQVMVNLITHSQHISYGDFLAHQNFYTYGELFIFFYCDSMVQKTFLMVKYNPVGI